MLKYCLIDSKEQSSATVRALFSNSSCTIDYQILYEISSGVNYANFVPKFRTLKCHHKMCPQYLQSKRYNFIICFFSVSLLIGIWPIPKSHFSQSNFGWFLIMLRWMDEECDALMLWWINRPILWSTFEAISLSSLLRLRPATFYRITMYVYFFWFPTTTVVCSSNNDCFTYITTCMVTEFCYIEMKSNLKTTNDHIKTGIGRPYFSCTVNDILGFD